MDIRRKLKLSPRGRRKKGDTAQLAAQLAPLEELAGTDAPAQAGSSPQFGKTELDPHYGAIVVDNENLHVPEDIMEGGNEKTYLGMEPVVLVIVGVLLAFIAFIAWQITLLPPE
jgi:hypothetical protein